MNISQEHLVHRYSTDNSVLVGSLSSSLPSIGYQHGHGHGHTHISDADWHAHMYAEAVEDGHNHSHPPMEPGRTWFKQVGTADGVALYGHTHDDYHHLHRADGLFINGSSEGHTHPRAYPPED